MSSKRLKRKACNLFKIIYATPLNVHTNDSGLTLDLSYITDKLIVCSYPVLKYPKLMYRNSLVDLVTFLNIKHGPGNWKIFNFKVESGRSDYNDKELFEVANRSSQIFACPDKTIATDASQDKNDVNQFISRRGWMDHCPPPFLLMQEIVDEIHEHLCRSQSSVVVLHCKVGKGRSGMICIAYMMKYLACPLSEGRDIFMSSRFKPGISRGVSIISQVRYLRYHERFLCYDHDVRTKVLADCSKAQFQLKSICLEQPSAIIPSNSCVVYIKIQTYNSSRDGLIDLATLETDEDLLGQPEGKKLTMCLPLNLDMADIRLEFGIASKTSNVITSVTSLASRSHCWLNLYWEILKCISDQSQSHFTLAELREQQLAGQEFSFSINWSELDGAKGTSNRGLKLFDSVTINWSLL